MIFNSNINLYDLMIKVVVYFTTMPMFVTTYLLGLERSTARCLYHVRQFMNEIFFFTHEREHTRPIEFVWLMWTLFDEFVSFQNSHSLSVLFEMCSLQHNKVLTKVEITNQLERARYTIDVTIHRKKPQTLGNLCNKFNWFEEIRFLTPHQISILHERWILNNSMGI